MKGNAQMNQPLQGECNMRRTVVFLFVLLLVVAPNTISYGMKEINPSRILTSASHDGHPSLDIHLAALESYEMKMTEIQKRIQRLESRLSYLTKKPHMDPQGFRRDSANRLLGHLTKKMKKIEQKITWHRDQIRQRQA